MRFLWTQYYSMNSAGGSGGWIYPKPETGNEMFIAFYYGHSNYACPLYCEKSGIFSVNSSEG